MFNHFIIRRRVIISKNKNRIYKSIITFVGIILVVGLVMGFRYYKTSQLKECIRNIKVEDVSAISLTSQKGFWSKPDSRILKDDAINELILMLQNQTFIYYMDDDAFYGRGYGTTEFVSIMISVYQQIPIELKISRNSEKGQLFVNVNYTDDLSAVYKFSNDTGTLFYDWLLEQ